MKKCPKMIHARDDLNHTAFTVAKNSETIEFMLEKFIVYQNNRSTNESSVITYQQQKSKTELSVLDRAFLVSCQYGNASTIKMIATNLVDPFRGNRSDKRVNVLSTNHEHRNGFFLAALNNKTEIMRYFIENHPELTKKSTDINGMNFSKNPNEITCPNMYVPDETLSISLIDSISQTGALKQRRIVRRLKNSIKLLDNLFV